MLPRLVHLFWILLKIESLSTKVEVFLFVFFLFYMIYLLFVVNGSSLTNDHSLYIKLCSSPLSLQCCFSTSLSNSMKEGNHRLLFKAFSFSSPGTIELANIHLLQSFFFFLILSNLFNLLLAQFGDVVTLVFYTA